MKTLDTEFWAGTELALANFIAGEKQDVTAMYGDSQAERDTPRLFSQVGGVGVITIAGALVNNDSWINAYVGRTGYPEIREALIHAATDPNIGAIVLDVNSGGGAVSGVADTAQLIKQIDSSMKPIHAFSDGQIASAAYWIGSSARSLDIGSVTEAGSIGVLTVHKEISKALEMEGVKATVLKAGEHKAAGNMYEPLSDKARAQIQNQLDYMYTMFVQQVAENRDVSYPVADTKMAQGKVFIGTQAVDAGLVDGISTFDAVISKVQGGIDAKKSTPQYGANFSKGPAMKVALTDQQIAAMAEAGITMPGAMAVAAIATPETEAARAAAAAAAVKTEAEPAAPAADAAPAAPAAPAEDAGVVAYLKTSLAEAQASNTNLTMELRDLKASSESMAATHTALREIAVASVDRLKVALGGTAGTAQALSDVALLAEHAAMRTQFESKFKAGGVAAVSTEATPDTKSEQDDPVRQARINATRLA